LDIRFGPFPRTYRLWDLTVLGKDIKCCFPPWDQAVYLLWWPSLTKDMQTEQLLGVVYNRHRDEEDLPVVLYKIKIPFICFASFDQEENNRGEFFGLNSHRLIPRRNQKF